MVPMAWFCIGLLLALNIYVHDRVWYQAAACEAVLAGNGREGGQGNGLPAELAEEKLEARLEEKIMPGGTPSFRVEENGQSTEIRLKGQVVSLGSRPLLEYQTGAEAERIRPVEFLRKYRALRKLTGTE